MHTPPPSGGRGCVCGVCCLVPRPKYSSIAGIAKFLASRLTLVADRVGIGSIVLAFATRKVDTILAVTLAACNDMTGDSRYELCL